MKFVAAFLIMLVSTQAFASQTKEYGVQGMVCAFCSQGIAKKFKERTEVKSVDVSLEKKKMKLEFHEGKSLSDEQVQKILESAGYKMTAMGG